MIIIECKNLVNLANFYRESLQNTLIKTDDGYEGNIGYNEQEVKFIQSQKETIKPHQLVFFVDDIGSSFESIRDNGATNISDEKETEIGVQITFNDPERNEVTLIQKLVLNVGMNSKGQAILI